MVTKIYMFDFCETLANFQTADRFVEYVIYNNKNICDKNFLFNLLYKIIGNKYLSYFFFKVFKISIKKRLLLWKIKGRREDELIHFAESYYKDEIRPNLIPEVLKELLEAKDNGYRTAIVSAGYDMYLRLFAEEYGVDDLICNKFIFEKGVFLGQIEGKDCIGKEKVSRLKKYYKKDSMKDIDSYAFSDSISDIPFLCYARKAVVVCHKQPNWAIEKGMDTLEW